MTDDNEEEEDEDKNEHQEEHPVPRSKGTACSHVEACSLWSGAPLLQSRESKSRTAIATDGTAVDLTPAPPPNPNATTPDSWHRLRDIWGKTVATALAAPSRKRGGGELHDLDASSASSLLLLLQARPGSRTESCN